VIQATDIELRAGAELLLSGATFRVDTGDRVGLVGRNGAGKTTLAQELKKRMETEFHTVDWFNADAVRQQYNDWDFSEGGRIRQSIRMRELAEKSTMDFVIRFKSNTVLSNGNLLGRTFS
jgi:ATPase subunit of ABC transporter with duplicated ATPase domains